MRVSRLVIVLMCAGSDFGFLLRAIAVLFFSPVADKARNPSFRYKANILDSHVILDRVVNAKVDPRCRGQCWVTVRHDYADRCLGNTGFSRKKLRLISACIYDSMFPGTNSRFSGGPVSVCEYRASKAELALSSNYDETSYVGVHPIVFVHDLV